MKIKQIIYNGQSLFEVVFAIGIAALVLVGVMSLSTTSLRNSIFSKNNTLATKYAQEGTEWIREQRDTNWTTFYPVANGATRNMGSLSWPPSGSCNIPNDTTFCRTVKLTSLGSDTVSALLLVTWTDGQGTHSVHSATTYTKWR